MNPAPPRSTCVRGTSLLETLGAATLVTLVLLALLGTIAFGLRGVQSSENHQRGVYHARKLFDLTKERKLFLHASFDDPPEARLALDAPPFQDDFPAATGFQRRLVTHRLSDNPDSFEYKLYSIEVTVFWKDKTRDSEFQIRGLARVP